MTPALQENPPYKFGDGAAEDQPWKYQNVWRTECSSSMSSLIIAPRIGHIDLLETLLEAMPEPMWILYVLVVPRGKSEAGRYQNVVPQSREAVQRFVREYRKFLEDDGRHNLWIRSESGEVQLVYDRHNLIYAYGRLNEFSSILTRAGLTEIESITVPDPHSHHYHAHFDSAEVQLLHSAEWRHTPLREQDQH